MRKWLFHAREAEHREETAMKGPALWLSWYGDTDHMRLKDVVLGPAITSTFPAVTSMGSIWN